jgi:hypothetical protein
MFNKKQTNNIENDFMEYSVRDNVQDEEIKNSGGGLGSIIQILIILILIGVLAIGGMFGYKYFQNDIQQTKNINTADNNLPTPVDNIDATLQKVVSKQPITNENGQKMYTQEQMKAIVQMMMAQMNNKLENPDAKNSTQEATQDNKLISSLEDIEVDQIQDITTKSSTKTDITQKITKKSSDKIDRFNKVVVKKNNKNIDDISSQISSAIEELDQKDSKKSTYTKSISNEISTRENEMRFIVVREGDSLSKIAKRAYGSVTAYDIIVEANPDLIKNPNRIFVGQKLRIPSITN